MTIGERIKFKREELNISQDELARRLGYKSRSSINKIELGLQNLNQSKIKAIADALQTTPSFIMGWTEDKKEPTPENEDGSQRYSDDSKHLWSSGQYPQTGIGGEVDRLSAWHGWMSLLEIR